MLILRQGQDANRFWSFDMYGFTTDYSDEEIVAIVKGNLKAI